MRASIAARHTNRPQRALASARSIITHGGAAHPIHRLQRAAGNRVMDRLLRGRIIQPKLTVSPDHEGGGQSDATPTVTPALESYVHSSRGGGARLQEAARAFFEPRVGRDLGDVRVHADEHAARASREISARAFTTGTNIYFGSGQYRPGTTDGNRLLAHELVHAVQQSPTPATRTVQQHAYRDQMIRRDDEKAAPSEAKKTNLYFVVGSKSLNVGGGVFLKDLEALQAKLLSTSLPGGEWTLTITIHGAETFFALSTGAVTGGITESDPGAYNKRKITSIFGDKKFQAWSQKHGPKRINLLSCQIGSDLENAFYKLVLHPTATQQAIGLGKGCILYNTPLEATVGGKHVRTRAQYQKLTEPEQETVHKNLTQWNNDYGYNGDKIKAASLLDYYFDVAPEGLWIQVEVRTTTGKLVSYLKRASDAAFIADCSPSRLKPRESRVPSVPREE